MEIGVVFPQTEFGSDPLAIREYGQVAEGLGFSHVVAYDHVLGANPDRPGGWQGPYTHETPFHEPFVLFGFMAAATERLRFATGILILPQRQTALVAKQAATLDVLSGGRLRLGVGIGWNEVEYIALGEEFTTRGRRSEEQVQVLRQLWTERLVTFQGQWHTIPDAGLLPLPVQRPIPIWFGGHADALLRRVAALGDGWFLNHPLPSDARPALDTLARYLEEAGRSQTEVGVEARLAYGDGKPERWRTLLQEWEAVGATHLSFNTMRCGFESPAAHLEALRTFAAAIGLGQ